jgi:hypothetical protein
VKFRLPITFCSLFTREVSAYLNLLRSKFQKMHLKTF